jgi:Na+-exporting ATPase
MFRSCFNIGKEELLNTLDIHLATEFSFDLKVKKMIVVYKDNRTILMDVYNKSD